MRDHLLNTLRTRLRRAAATRDPSGLRSDEALAEAEALLAHAVTAEGEPDAEVLHLTGMLRWYRAATAGSPEEGAAEGTAATLILSPLYLARPDLLPEEVRAWYAQTLGDDEPFGEERAHAYAESLSNLAMLLMARGLVPDEPRPRRTAIVLLRDALARLPGDHPSRPVVQCNLGYALVIADSLPAAGEGPPALPHLAEATALLREAYAATPRDHPGHARCANGLALALRQGYAAAGGDPALLDEAIGLFRTAVDTAGDLDDNLPQILADFAEALLLRTARAGESAPDGLPSLADLDEAVSAAHRSVELTPDEAPELAFRLATLNDALAARYEQSQSAADLDGCVEALRGLLEVLPEQAEAERAAVRLQLAQVLMNRQFFHRPTGAEGLEEVTALMAEAAAAMPEGSEERASTLAAMESIARHGTPHRVFDTPSELDDIDLRLMPRPGTVPTTESDHMNALIGELLGLGAERGESRDAQLMDFMATVLRYPHRASLDEVMAAGFRTLEQRYAHLPPEERQRAMARVMNADARPAGPAEPPDTSDVDEVLGLVEQALRDLPADHPGRVLLRLSRVQLVLVREMHAGNPDAPARERIARLTATMPTMDDLAGMLRSLSERVDFTPDLFRPMIMLGSATWSPFEALAMGERGVRARRAEVAAAPDDPEALAGLAFQLFLLHDLADDDAAYREATALARRLVAGDRPVNTWMLGAWAGAAAGRLQLAALATRPPEESELPSSRLARLAIDQAATSLDEYDAPGALEALEEGRAHMLSHALNTRRELDDVRRADSGLARELEEVRARLTGLVPAWPPTGESTAEYHGLLREWGELTGRLRDLPGFDRFLLPLPLGLADLRPAGAEGPVVTVNVHPRRCDALILDPDGLRTVPLPDLRAGELAEQAGAFHAAVESAAAGGALAGAANQVVLDTLSWLWDVLAEPVLTELGLTGPPAGDWPRLWWSPGGALTSLPLHAAGHHTVPGASVLDRAVSSYTPTLRALMLSRARPVPRRRTPLAVAMPKTPGHRPLPRTVAEASALAAETLLGPEATRAAVLAALPGAHVAHFACHAAGDPADPGAGHLLLHDGPLGLTDISRLTLRNAELAYLSACGTARGGARLADEAIHVASAFQLAGFTQAIATLWEIGDGFAASVAADVHRELAPAMAAPARLPAALALHTVTRRVRAELPGRPLSWAALIHAGA
ncbi:CHAT domain-containing protein [Streptomyces litchfieldiae]|uniref:CHAT domain-containing protein n=1 Tax=Streptomyces litchfieldiae TaxID=3075543 RepID=A0ABU2MLY2_9ACTN|nr:CHAT domain-containing protein [Streptomyces sp. DSM 44938]MDT0342550.1 CHAT domain-containing protein [Streptomyces sp. DSM 44938]